MKSKDVIRKEFRQKLETAMSGTDPNAVVDVFTQFAEELQTSVMEDYNTFCQTNDVSILNARGVHQLTQEEKKFYQAVVNAVQTKDVTQAFNGLENAYPETVINSVLEGIRNEFPLLSKIDLVGGTKLITKFLKNGSAAAFAQWGQINSAITKELTGEIELVDITLCKLTAWIPISKDMLRAGLEWLDSYVRALLVEAIGNSMSKAVISGTGKNEPIGMTRDCSDTATVTGGVYPEQEAIEITGLSVDTFCALYAKLAKDSKDKHRKVTNVIFIVNPIDYYLRILPKIAYRNASGEYVYTLPLPIEFIQEPNVEEGTAIVGIGKGYFLGVGFGDESGAIDFDDSYRYVEDLRVYTSILHGNGMPKDSNNFLFLDISALPSVTTTADKTAIEEELDPENT